MPRAADRLLPPIPCGKPRRPFVALATVATSLAIHGVAVAAAIGLWGAEEVSVPRPIEVVMVTVTRPGRAPAPGATTHAPAPTAPSQAGPPVVAMPVAEAAAPAVRAPVPVASTHTSKPAAAEVVPATIEPIRQATQAPAVAADRTPPPSAMAEVVIDQVRIDRVAPAAVSAPIAEPPRPAARPAPAQTQAQPTALARAPTGTPVETAARTAQAPAGRATSLATLTGTQPASHGGTDRAEFALGSAANPAPDYPYRARQRGWQGRVVLRVDVDREGRPIRIAIAESSGHGVLDDAATGTIATWTFQPARRGGQTVAGEAMVPVVFRLN
ncbi:MAG: energy transducer TonB [Thalassobaculaceae bacterium]|nr:energy transducer TonB [Thalassobaculaceae bacterium]